MKKLFPAILLLLLCSAIFFACNRPLGSVVYKNKTFSKKYDTPPGTIRIGENFFADETELPNLYYREYLYWVSKVHGDSLFLESLPDTTVWNDELVFASPYVETYHQHPAFDMYPVVGLSHKQASDYLKWRSDRVYEMLLIEKGVIEPHFDQSADNYFSIEHYLSGNYFDYQPDTAAVPYIPKYRLPTEEEWEFLAGGGLDKSKYPYGFNTESGRIYKIMNKKKNKNSKLYNLKFAHDPESDLNENITSPAPVTSFLPNDYGIYHTIGNLAEMTATPGIAKGGSFLHKKAESSIANYQTYDKPTKWLGLRGVCTWETVATYLNPPLQ